MTEDDSWQEIGVPNCPTDLVPMELAGDGDAAHWRCPECGLIRLG